VKTTDMSVIVYNAQPLTRNTLPTVNVDAMGVDLNAIL